MTKTTRKRKNLDIRTGKSPRFVVFSFKDFDINQGQRFEKWEADQILSNLMNRLHAISAFTVEQAISNQMIKVYGDFPKKSDFYYPKHVSDGVNWGTIKIQGKERICGYLEENVFFIVFLDQDHRFWISEKKHT